MRPAPTKRSRGPILAGILAIIVIVSLLAGLVVTVRENDNGSVLPAIDRNGAVTNTTVASPVAVSTSSPGTGS